MKKITFFALLLLTIITLVNVINLSSVKKIFKIKANNIEVKLILKLQGDYSHYNQNKIFANIVFYNPYKKIKEFNNVNLSQVQNNIFSANFSLENLDVNQPYFLFIKPNKYFGKITKNQIFKTTDVNIIDLSNEYFLSGDLEPQDGKITAYDISLILKNLGDQNNYQTDINSDGITDTQDYSLALFSLINNTKDEEFTLLPTPTPTLTPTLTLTPTPTSTPKPTPTPSPMPTNPIPSIPNSHPTSTLTSIPYPSPTGSSFMHYCQLMENELPMSRMIYPNGSTNIPKTTEKICSWSSNYFYSLPYRNPNCDVTQEMIDKAYEKMKSFYPKYYQQSKLKEQWEIVQKLSKKYNFNPIFVISLWLEESAAGGANAQQLGCIYRRNRDDSFTNLGPESNICEQMECLFGSGAVDPNNFAFWACRYQHGYNNWDDENNNCKKVTTFTRTLEFWYNYMTDYGKKVPQECQIIKYKPSDQQCP